MVIEALIFTHYKQNLKTIIETDFSDYISNWVFSQLSNNELLHPIAFCSKNLKFVKYNWKIHEKELLFFK